MTHDTAAVRDGHEISGFCFTPQDGNALLSSLSATAWYLDPDAYEQRLQLRCPTCLTKCKRRPAPGTLALVPGAVDDAPGWWINLGKG